MFRSTIGRMAVLLCALALSLSWSPGAFAQATRTWVSGVGDDANPCSRTAPCKTFAGAISKTAAGGTIDVLDPGGFGTVTITKSITIEADGDYAGVSAAGVNGVIVSAGAADTVTLRGLAIDGAGATLGVNGVRFLAGRTLVLDRVTIRNFNGSGVSFEPSTAATLAMRGVTISRTGQATSTAGAIFVAPTGTGSAALDLDDVHTADDRYGLSIAGPATGVVRDSTIASPAEDGIVANAPTAAVDVTLDGVAINDAGTNGIAANGANAVLRISGCAVTGSAQGLLVSANGRIVSFGDNRIGGNVVNGAPTQVQALQ